MLEKQTNLWSQTTHYPVQAVIFSPDGAELVSGGGEAGNALIWNSANGMLEGRLPEVHTGWIRALAFSPDGTKLASSGIDARVGLWNVASRQLIGSPIVVSQPVCGLAFSGDAHLLAAACGDGAIRICDVQAQHQVGILRGHLAAALSVVFAPDGG